MFSVNKEANEAVICPNPLPGRIGSRPADDPAQPPTVGAKAWPRRRGQAFAVLALQIRWRGTAPPLPARGYRRRNRFHSRREPALLVSTPLTISHSARPPRATPPVRASVGAASESDPVPGGGRQGGRLAEHGRLDPGSRARHSDVDLRALGDRGAGGLLLVGHGAGLVGVVGADVDVTQDAAGGQEGGRRGGLVLAGQVGDDAGRRRVDRDVHLGTPPGPCRRRAGPGW